jgi:hypothetical protein
MFFIYSAATVAIRRAKFEIFFTAHHFFLVFFIILLLHGPIFWMFALIPLSLYAVDKAIQNYHSSRAFTILSAEWVEPVLCLKFAPVDRSQFSFKEGQYVHLNCPYIGSEWHPFTISSACGDLGMPGSGMTNSMRVLVQTGEEVYKVPRPSSLGENEKWSKYCPVSVDSRDFLPHELHEKHETCRMNYVSCHIKVHGLKDAKAKTWTRKFKEYLELLSSGVLTFYALDFHSLPNACVFIMMWCERCIF